VALQNQHHSMEFSDGSDNQCVVHTIAKLIYNVRQTSLFIIHCVQKKKHPLTFSFISPWIICGAAAKIAVSIPGTQGLIDSDNVKIRYSLRSMT